MGTLLKELWAIDIETVSQGARAEEYSQNVEVKTGNIKDPEKIKAKQDEALVKARSMLGLSWVTGKVFCVSLVNCDTGERKSFIGFNELEMLTALRIHLDKTLSGMSHLYAKSGKDFDYPFLIGRYIANNARLPKIFKEKYSVLDIDDLLTMNKQSSQRDKLSAYAHGMEIDGKLMHGSKVQDEYNRALLAKGDDQVQILKDMVDYCEQDAVIVAEFVKRYYGEEY